VWKWRKSHKKKPNAIATLPHAKLLRATPRLAKCVARRSGIPLHMVKFKAKSGVAEFLIVSSGIISFCSGNSACK
jgi:hypothetical protein